MEFIKKQSVGFYLSVAALVLTLFGIIFYGVNTGTTYFKNMGVDGGLVALTILAMVSNVGLVVASQFITNKKLLDVLYVLECVFIAVAFIILLNIRLYNIATIMTFEKNDQTMGDLVSCIVAIVFYVLALLTSVASAFFRVTKEDRI